MLLVLSSCAEGTCALCLELFTSVLSILLHLLFLSCYCSLLVYFIGNCRPDMIFAVDWALKANYLSIYHWKLPVPVEHAFNCSVVESAHSAAMVLCKTEENVVLCRLLPVEHALAFNHTRVVIVLQVPRNLKPWCSIGLWNRQYTFDQTWHSCTKTKQL